MNDTGTARMLARYTQWANRVMLDAVAALPAGESTKERPTLFKTMVRTLNHIYTADVIWQAHLEGRPHGIPALSHVLHPELPELDFAMREMDQWWVDWADAQTPATLAQTVGFELIGGNKGEMTRGEILMHVVTHCSYHRGWVGDMFFQVPGHRAPTMDLPVYKRVAAQRAAA